MFRDDQGLRFGKIEHLPRGVARGRRTGQGTAAPATGLGEMIDGGIGVFCPTQRFAGVALLSAGLLAGAYAQAAGAGGLLLQPITGRRLAAVAAVQPELALQFGVACLKRGDLGLLLGDSRLKRNDQRFKTRHNV